MTINLLLLASHSDMDLLDLDKDDLMRLLVSGECTSLLTLRKAILMQQREAEFGEVSNYY